MTRIDEDKKNLNVHPFKNRLSIRPSAQRRVRRRKKFVRRVRGAENDEGEIRNADWYARKDAHLRYLKSE